MLLHFGAVDWEATVWVNGKEQGTHRGGYDGFSFDITDALRPAGAQEIVVRVFDPSSAGDQPRGKQVENPGGIFYTPTTGIWQTVWLEPVSVQRIERLDITPDLDASALRLTAVGAGTAEADSVEVIVRDGKNEVARTTGKPGAELAIQLPAAKRWTPQDPHLYDLEVALTHEGKVSDRVESYFGLRKIGLAPMRKAGSGSCSTANRCSRWGRSTRASGPMVFTPRRPMKPCATTSKSPRSSASI